MLAPQVNIIMVRPKGITDQRISSAMPLCTDARQFLLGAPPVADGEVEDRAENQQREEDRHRQQEVQQVVHVGREGGRLFRK